MDTSDNALESGTAEQDQPQNRKLGLFLLSGLVIGSMIGGGGFNLPQNMSAHASLGAIAIAWLITLVGMCDRCGEDQLTPWGEGSCLPHLTSAAGGAWAAALLDDVPAQHHCVIHVDQVVAVHDVLAEEIAEAQEHQQVSHFRRAPGRPCGFAR